jgi:hypothetical protein
MSNNLTKTHTHTERDIYIIIIIFGVPRPIHCGTPSLLHPLGRFGGFSRRAPPRPSQGRNHAPNPFPADDASPHTPSQSVPRYCCHSPRPIVLSAPSPSGASRSTPSAPAQQVCRRQPPAPPDRLRLHHVQDVGCWGYPKIRMRHPNTVGRKVNMFKYIDNARGDKESPKNCSNLKSCESFYTCPCAPFYRETKGLLHSESTLESKEYFQCQHIHECLLHLIHLQACH